MQEVDVNLHVKISPIPPPPKTTPLLLYLPIAYSIYAEFSELETDVGKKEREKESLRLFYEFLSPMHQSIKLKIYI